MSHVWFVLPVVAFLPPCIYLSSAETQTTDSWRGRFVTTNPCVFDSTTSTSMSSNKLAHPLTTKPMSRALFKPIVWTSVCFLSSSWGRAWFEDAHWCNETLGTSTHKAWINLKLMSLRLMKDKSLWSQCAKCFMYSDVSVHCCPCAVYSHHFLLILTRLSLRQMNVAKDNKLPSSVSSCLLFRHYNHPSTCVFSVIK